VKVYTVTIFDYESIVHTSCHSTREKAKTYLAAWCRGDWQGQGNDAPLPQDEDNAINEYFQTWDLLTWGINQADVDPDPRDVDHDKDYADYVSEDEEE
jgi:hypothetical protein